MPSPSRIPEISQWNIFDRYSIWNSRHAVPLGIFALMEQFVIAAARKGAGTDLVIAIVIAVGVAGFYVYRKAREAAVRARVEAAAVPAGYVRIVYHTYTGFLVFVNQRRTEIVTSPETAQTMLNAALRHNLTWGMFAYGMLFIPLLSWLEYRAQMKKVSNALQRGFQVTQGR